MWWLSIAGLQIAFEMRLSELTPARLSATKNLHDLVLRRLNEVVEDADAHRAIALSPPLLLRYVGPNAHDLAAKIVRYVLPALELVEEAPA